MAERIVLVTGCSSGIGLGVAQRLHSRGWHVIAGLRDASRTPPALECARRIALDVTQPAQVAQAAAAIERLDCLINNAGYALTGPFASYTAEQMERQLRVNLLGPALLTQQLLPALKRAGGRVINVSSLAGEAGLPMMAMYCAAKHALEGWSESLRHELAAAGVQVALVEPGGFRTRFAENMEWGARPMAPESGEARQLGRYRAMQARMLARPGRIPNPVIDAIVRLAEMKRMPLRTRVGSDARLLRGLKRWLPERVSIGLIGAAFRRRLA
ncbi:MAG TPA: SDR family oxidoreductase [Burkholderiales bacterium]|nr:SDR family oxidoreductase [Burkholderiales bacterium]